jgi:hypothetical protein
MIRWGKANRYEGQINKNPRGWDARKNYYESTGAKVVHNPDTDDKPPPELGRVKTTRFNLLNYHSPTCVHVDVGKYPLASQGKHYDLGWLRKYESDEEWSDGNSKLGKRPMLGPTADDSNTLFKTPTA